MHKIIYKVVDSTEVYAVQENGKQAHVFQDYSKRGRYWFVVRKNGTLWDWEQFTDLAPLEAKMQGFEPDPNKWEIR